MKVRLSFLLAFLCLANLLPAQIRLVGTRYDQAAQLHDVFRWNASTGAIFDSIRTNQQFIVASGSAFDSQAGAYYFRTSNGLNKAEFNPGVHTFVGPADLGNNAEIDMANGRIFGVGTEVVRDSNNVPQAVIVRFKRHNITAGTDTVLGLVPNIRATYADGSAFNSNTGRYFFLAIDSVLGTCIYSIPTRDSVFSYTRASVNVPDLRVLELMYDNEYNVLYSINFNDSTAVSFLELYTLDANTGAMTRKASWPQLRFYQLTTLTMDQASSTLIFTAGSPSSMDLQLYRTVQDTLLQGVLPGNGLAVNEIEADNRQFALNKYGSITAVAPARLTAVRVYPNPASDVLRIEDADLVSLRVFDTGGRLLFERSGWELDHIDVRNWAPGLYFLRGSTRDGSEIGAKFIKE